MTKRIGWAHIDGRPGGFELGKYSRQLKSKSVSDRSSNQHWLAVNLRRLKLRLLCRSNSRILKKRMTAHCMSFDNVTLLIDGDVDGDRAFGARVLRVLWITRFRQADSSAIHDRATR